MSNTTRTILGVIVVVAIVAAGALIYIWVSGGSGEASQPITAPTLDPNRNAGETDVTEALDEADAAATEAMAEATAAVMVEAEADAAAESEPAEAVLFEIVPEESEVRFILDEELQGQPTTVVGITDQVAGQIFVDFANPASSELGVIRINARTLRTDNEFRNRAIRGQILQSQQDEYEFIDFTPTALEGLPETVTMGEAFTFQVTGDLTIRDITNPTTFEVTVTPVSEERLEGSASAEVLRSDYELNIPSVPNVANVTDEVQLEIDFVAVPAAA